jgi:hypothetical protein
MKRSFAWITSIVAGGVLFATLVPLAAQTPATGFKPRRTPDNQPDFQGIWQAMGSAHFNLEPHSASFGIPAGLGVIVDPPDGKIPYTAAGRAKREENLRNRGTLDPHSKCYKPGVPHLMYLPFPLQIIQSKTQVTIVSEYIHNTRHIYLNRKQHYPTADAEFWNGDSFGRFEGDTFITDVANFSPQPWLDRSGNHHSEQLRVVERFNLIDADTIRYEATLEDSKTYTRPWRISLLLYRRKEPNIRLLEYECHAYADNALKDPVLPKAP